MRSIEMEAVELACQYLCATDRPNPTLEGRIAAAQALRAMLLRDWAVRVLDAFTDARSVSTESCWSHQSTAAVDASGAGLLIKHNGAIVYDFDGESPDDARLAAAEAVWPELPESARAELGERP